MNKLGTAAITVSMAVLLVCLPAFAGEHSKATPISACNTFILEPGEYRLVNDLVACDEVSFSTFRNGITIYTHDVVLDLGGHTISCQRHPDYFGFGILVDTGSSRIQVRNGMISGCDIGVLMSINDNTTLKSLGISGNGTGISMNGGSDNEIRDSRIIGNEGDGIYANGNPSYGGYVGPSSGNRFEKNLVSDNWGVGISADGLDTTTYACNRADRNGVTGIGLTNIGSGNVIKGNIAKNNGIGGIAAYGLAFGDFVFQPIPEGNIFKHNSASGNGSYDLLEALLDVATFNIFVSDDAMCLNNWKNNRYVSALGPLDCVTPTKKFNEQGCAPNND